VDLARNLIGRINVGDSQKNVVPFEHAKHYQEG
jgi:hypothetical protein